MSDREKAFDQWWHLTSHIWRPESRESLARQAYYAAWGGGDIARITAERDGMKRALESLLDRYVGLVNCGDCGFWDPEKEREVIEARAALAVSDADDTTGGTSNAHATNARQRGQVQGLEREPNQAP